MILNKMITRTIFPIGAALFLISFSSEILGQTDIFVLAGMGVGNILDRPQGGYVSFELRKPIIKHKDVIFSGNVVLEGEKGEKYVGLGVSAKKRLSGRVSVAATTGIGRFSNINLNLGSKTEFRSGVDLFYKISRKVMLVMSFYHYSNGGISNYNPGAESVALRVVLPLARNS